MGDEEESWRPSRYRFSKWGCSLAFRFPTVKLIDVRTRWEDLEASDNPFPTVVMTHRKGLETRRDPWDRKNWKMRLIRRMDEGGFDKKTILDLFRFIDWILALPEELERQLENELEAWEEERKMPYIPAIERRGMERGRQEGWQEGRQEGRLAGLQRSLLLILRHRSGEIPTSVEHRLQNASCEERGSWIDASLEAPS